jgi:RimJ/RimL family protein N-acetyltransferase
MWKTGSSVEKMRQNHGRRGGKPNSMVDVASNFNGILEVGHLRLRRWGRKDAHCVLAAALDPYIPQVTSIPAGCDEPQAIDWIDRQNQKILAGTDLPLCVATGPADVAVGMMGLFGLHAPVVSCGYWISPKNRGVGVAGAALDILASWAFRDLSVDVLEMRVEPGNSASIRAAESAGFTVDRTLAANMDIGGVLRDMVRYVRVKAS